MSQAAESQHHAGLARTIRVLQDHVGIKEGISQSQLAEEVDVHVSTLRNWIEQLRREGWPIGSINGYGYFLMSSEDDFRAVMASLEKARASKAETMSALASAYYGEGQRFYYGTGSGADE